MFMIKQEVSSPKKCTTPATPSCNFQFQASMLHSVHLFLRESTLYSMTLLQLIFHRKMTFLQSAFDRDKLTTVTTGMWVTELYFFCWGEREKESMHNTWMLWQYVPLLYKKRVDKVLAWLPVWCKQNGTEQSKFHSVEWSSCEYLRVLSACIKSRVWKETDV